MPGRWSRVECEAIVADYLDMLARECRGERYSKAEHRRNLHGKLDNRSRGSIEYKHQNITAVLLRAGEAYIRGYKPAWNYQLMLEEVVFEQLEQRSDELAKISDALLAETAGSEELTDWQSLFVEPPELDEMREMRLTQDRGTRVPRVVNYAEKESRNRALGERGEAFVLEIEKRRLFDLDRQDLAAEVEWTSKVRGDGAGYDIRSFRGDTDDQLFIEVKTTNSGKYQPFFISDNEVKFSSECAGKYSLYRIFDFGRSPALFELKGAVTSHVHLVPRLFTARF